MSPPAGTTTSSGIVSAVAIVVFIASWNNFLWPFLVITSPKMMTIPIGLTQVQSEFGVHNASNMAMAILGGLPVALLYLLFQNRVAQGFLADPGRAKMRALDVEPIVSTPRQFTQTMAEDTRRWRDLAQRLGIKPE